MVVGSEDWVSVTVGIEAFGGLWRQEWVERQYGTVSQT